MMENILVPVWTVSINPEFEDEFGELTGMTKEDLLQIARIHNRVIINTNAEVIQGFGLIFAYRLLGREWAHVWLQVEEPKKEWTGADFKGFEIRTGPEGHMRIV